MLERRASEVGRSTGVATPESLCRAGDASSRSLQIRVEIREVPRSTFRRGTL